MTYEQFWLQDTDLAKYYRQAEELRLKENNRQLHLQGMYIYDAISTVVYNTWCRGKGKPAASYPNDPYPLTLDDIEKSHEDRIKEEKAKAQVWMENLVISMSSK